MTDDLRASIRAQAPPAATALLDELVVLGTPSNDERKTPRDVHDRIVATIRALTAAGLAQQDAVRFALAAPWRPLVGPLFAALALTRAERTEVLQAFVRPENDQHYPVLDLSRQELDHVPPECADVTIAPANIGTDDEPVPYRELNLGYDPLEASETPLGEALSALADGADPALPHLAAAARTRAMLDALGTSVEL